MLQYAVPPGYQRQQPIKRPKLGPWLGVIDAVLDDDKQRPVKQRHTAKRIFERLKEEHQFTGGYTIVKDYVRGEQLRTREMFVPLTHAPGEAQVDFGEALVVIAGVEQKAHYLAMVCHTRTIAWSWRFRPRPRKPFWKAMCEPSRTSAACPLGFFTTTPRSPWPRSWAVKSGNQLLQPHVLFLQHLHLTDLIHFQANVLGLPSVKGLLADPSLPDQLNHRNSNFGLLQHSNDLLQTESLLHQQILHLLRLGFAED
jgi:hypothetical protein